MGVYFMPDGKTVRFASILAVGLITLLAFVYLAADNTARRQDSASQQRAAWLIPSAIETYSPPTFTPDLRPTPTYAPPPTLEPPPQAQTFPAEKSAPAPNVAWSSERDDSLTIWVGQYSDNPTPAIVAARPVARWVTED